MVEQDESAIYVTGFRGLQKDVLNPAPESCRTGKNFVLDDVPGELTVRNGTRLAIQAFDSVPFTGTASTNPYLVFSRRTSHQVVAWETMHVAQGGGRDVHVAVMKYRLNPFTQDSGVTLTYTYGMFVFPWWDGTQWLNQWRELTEFWDFRVYDVVGDDGTDTDTPLHWLVLDEDIGGGLTRWPFGSSAGGSVFPISPGIGGTGAENEYYFRGWTIENLEAGNSAKRFTRALQTRLDGASGQYLFQMRIPSVGTQTAFEALGWAEGDRIRVHRNYVYRANRFASGDTIVTDPFLYTIQDGLRYSNGVGTNKARFFIGWQEHQLSAAFPKEQIANGLVMADQCIEHYPGTVFVGFSQNTSGNLPAATYTLRYAVKEGPNWSKLYPCPAYDVGNTRWDGTAAAQTTLASPGGLQCSLEINVAILPRRATAVRVYLESDDTPGFSFLAFEKDLTVLGAGTEDATSPYWDGTTEHERYGFAESFVIADHLNGAEASADLGRSPDDDGVGYYSVAAATGDKVVFADVEISGVRFPSRLHVAPASGDGARQYDIIAKDPTNYIDTSKGDGIRIVALGGLSERVLVLTQRSIGVLRLGGDKPLWTYDTLSTDDGIATRNTLVVIDEHAYWGGTTALWRYSLNEGRQLLNPDWIKTYRTIADKTTAKAGFVQSRGYYLLYIDGVSYFFPTRSASVPVTEAMPHVLTFTPVWISKNPIALAMVGAENVYSYPGEQKDYLNTNIAAEFETNDFRVGNPLREAMVLHGVRIEYESDVDVTLEAYKDDDSAVFGVPIVFSKDHTWERRMFRLGFQCGKFRLKLKVTIATEGHECRIKRLVIFRTIQAAGGNVHAG